MHDPYEALYIHVPFCKQRCLYCDFATQAVASDSPLLNEYLEHMLLAIRRASREGFLGSIKTVYLGGGTPSYLGQGRLTELLYMLSLSMHLEPEVECTMEANPDSITSRLLKDIYALGVNRLSIGVQSFDDAILLKLGRIHTAEQARQAVKIAHERFENISVDLMCGIPGQSIDQVKQSVQTAIDLGVTHVSMYPLTIEEHTPFWNLVMAETMPMPDEDESAAHMKAAEELLTAAGFKRYEVASYARPGFECRHNIAYWTGVPYLGLGPSAVTMTQNDQRRMRRQDNEILDDLDAKQLRVEDIMLGMRMSNGISDETVSWAAELAPSIESVLVQQQEKGLVIHEDGRWKPTELGWLCGNELFEAILDVAP